MWLLLLVLCATVFGAEDSDTNDGRWNNNRESEHVLGGGGQGVDRLQLAVVTKKPAVRLSDIPSVLLPLQSRESAAEDEGGQEEEMVEYNIAAFGKDYKLQFSKNKILLPPGFRMDWMG
jgi:hypothetical protein